MLGVARSDARLRRRQRRARQRARQRRRRRQGGLPVRARDHPLLPGEEPILEQVPTYVCRATRTAPTCSSHLERAGGQGGRRGRRLRHADGPAVDPPRRDEFATRIIADPRRYIAQHRVELSTCPTWMPTSGWSPRRVDLRPYVLTGREGPWVLPGGLTRVALREGSYVVNSSQGGGSKDTWVLRRRRSGRERRAAAAARAQESRSDRPRRRVLLLAAALPRALRLHRAAHLDQPGDAARRRAPARRALAAAARRRRRGGELHRAARRRRVRRRRGGAGVSHLERGEPGLDPLLRPQRARERAHHPRDALARGLGNAQPVLALAHRWTRPAALQARARELLRGAAPGGAALSRRLPRDHAARSAVRLSATRDRARARRADRAHARRQVPPDGARSTGKRRTRARTNSRCGSPSCAARGAARRSSSAAIRSKPSTSPSS